MIDHGGDMRASVDAAFAALTGSAPTTRLFVPGRIEVFGKHTDYAGGRSLTCAVERGFAVAYAPRADGLVRLLDAADGRVETFPLGSDLAPTVGQWSNYPMTVARRLASNFPGMAVGADMAFGSTLPRAAGLSSSSALITATYLVLAAVNELAARQDYLATLPTPEALAGYLGAIENGQAFGALLGDSGVGTSGGSEDHTAILLSESDRLAWYGYWPVTRLGRVALDPALTLAVAASGVAAMKTRGARDRYNRASALVAALLAEWRRLSGRADPTLAHAIASAPDAVRTIRSIAATGVPPFPRELLTARLEHFLLEDGVFVPAAVAAFAEGRLDELGRVSEDSQRAAEVLLGNQVPETIALVGLARTQGAIAASAFGAGFGGSVWALVPVDGARGFLERWRDAYASEFPATAAAASFFLTRPAGGADSV